jgi:hypothetical protein
MVDEINKSLKAGYNPFEAEQVSDAIIHDIYIVNIHFNSVAKSKQWYD